MDALSIRLRTKFVQTGLRMILLLNLTSHMWPQDTPVSDIQVYYDYIIVGCGTAGSILANRLTANSTYKVLVLEAGGDPPIESFYPNTASYLPNSKYDWNFTTINDGYIARGHRENVLELTSGKVLGGGSSLGHLLYVRGHPSDYNNWAKMTKDQSWNYKNLLRYFQKSESFDGKRILNSHYGKYHGRDGNMGVTKYHKDMNKKYLHAFKEAGHNILVDANGENTIGYYEPMFMLKDGIRHSMPYTYLTQIKNRPNLHLLKEAEAIKIDIEGNRAVGVTAIKNNKIIKVKAKREIIVSAGTFKSPQLLMLSGIGLKDHLESFGITVKANLPVGKNYQDHLGVLLVHKLNIKNNQSPPANPHEPLSIVMGNVALDKSNHFPAYQSLNYITSNDEDILSLCSVSHSFNDQICQSLYNKTKGFQTMVSKIVLLHPSSRGHVLLQSKDYRVPPMIISGFYSHDEDLDSMTKYIDDFLRVMKTNGFRKHGVELVYPKLEECLGYPGAAFWKCYALGMVGTTYHYTSTCSMGKVVDSRLNVYGIKGLRVVDASVIPLVTSGHTQAAVMAIAEKAAEMILEDADKGTSKF